MRQDNMLSDVRTCGESPDASEPAHQPTFDEQFGIRFGLKRYYINLRVGTEQRSNTRVQSEGQVSVSGIPVLYCVFGGGFMMLFGALCMLYLLKSGTGIDLSDGHSIFHPLFALAGD